MSDTEMVPIWQVRETEKQLCDRICELEIEATHLREFRDAAIGLRDDYLTLMDERDALRAEVEDLRTDVARLEGENNQRAKILGGKLTRAVEALRVLELDSGSSGYIASQALLDIEGAE